MTAHALAARLSSARARLQRVTSRAQHDWRRHRKADVLRERFCTRAGDQGEVDSVRDSGVASTSTSSATVTLSVEKAFKRMWTRADKWHVHGISGGAYTVLGAALMAQWASQDVSALTSSSYVMPELDLITTEISLALATVCALSGLPLSKSRGWRKTELSLRSVAFQLVLTWEALRFSGIIDRTVEHVPLLDDFSFATIPFVWQTCTTSYILLCTKDDKRSAIGVWLGVLGFGAQIFPAHAVLDSSTVAALDATRPGLSILWTHSVCGLIWLLNWSTFGASLRARAALVDDAKFRANFLARPSLFWLALFVCDITAHAPFVSFADYLTSKLGAVVVM